MEFLPVTRSPASIHGTRPDMPLTRSSSTAVWYRCTSSCVRMRRSKRQYEALQVIVRRSELWVSFNVRLQCLNITSVHCCASTTRCSTKVYYLLHYLLVNSSTVSSFCWITGEEEEALSFLTYESLWSSFPSCLLRRRSLNIHSKVSKMRRVCVTNDITDRSV